MSVHRPSPGLSLVLGGLFFLLLPACGDPPAPSGAAVTAEPAPASASAAVVAPSGVATAEAAPQIAKGPAFLVRGKASSHGRVFWVGAGVVACPNHDCDGDAEMITEKGVVDTYNPRSMFQFTYGYLFKRELSQTAITYRGEYPHVCASFTWWNDRSDFGGVALERTGKTWAAGSDCETARYTVSRRGRPPRELDDALLHAPLPGAAESMIHGASGPTLLLADRALHAWDGKRWSRRDAPWGLPSPSAGDGSDPVSRAPVRLQDGSTFLPVGGYLIDRQGALSVLDLRDGDRPLEGVEVTGAVWTEKGPFVLAEDKETTYFLTGEVAMKRAEIPARESKKKDPPAPPPAAGTAAPSSVDRPAQAPSAAAPSAAPGAAATASSAASTAASAGTAPDPGSTGAPAPPSGSAAAASTGTAVAASAPTGDAASGSPSASAGSASAPSASTGPASDPTAGATAAPAASPDDLPAPRNFTPACATPFVLMATPPKHGQTYATTREGLRGHGELQDTVTFLEVESGGKLYFGAAVRTEDEARKLMSLIESSIKGMKPQLTCLDVLSRVTDRYAPPKGIRLISFNMTTGELVPLD